KNTLGEEPQGSTETQASDKRQRRGITLMSDTRWGSKGKTAGAFLDPFNAARSEITERESGTSSDSNEDGNR
ncbi:hypothetical protein M9458_039320, partial [Cirrhinus mrigala]